MFAGCCFLLLQDIMGSCGFVRQGMAHGKKGRMVKKLCLWDKKHTFVVENKLQWKRALI